VRIDIRIFTALNGGTKTCVIFYSASLDVREFDPQSGYVETCSNARHGRVRINRNI